ncbi:12598_t:CDS:2 [Ambispora gerdemannii]|uniref:4-hydroxy-3-methoxy-5-polyprenylbenzoate decarboxylase n=1 Tax=Ambispora gerdemannii TaxID=144530 RepID=A0A9N8VC16_9GLOM|nr:12598_t:CDS:2 [Ambispora gerdemannii]
MLNQHRQHLLAKFRQNSVLIRFFSSTLKAHRNFVSSVYGDNTTSTNRANQNEHFSKTSGFQKVLLSVASAFTALLDPSREDMVATLGETTGTIFLERIRDKMLQDKTGRRILRDQPIINTQTIDLNFLRQLPKTTFGSVYVGFLDKYQVTPDTRTKVQYIDDPELAYVMRRFREAHDFFHTLTNLPTTIEGELVLKWFELAQTGLPVSLLSSLFGHLRLTSEERSRLFDVYVPWAVQCGSSSQLLMNVYFEECFEKDLDVMRKELGIYVIDELKK